MMNGVSFNLWRAEWLSFNIYIFYKFLFISIIFIFKSLYGRINLWVSSYVWIFVFIWKYLLIPSHMSQTHLLTGALRFCIQIYWVQFPSLFICISSCWPLIGLRTPWPIKNKTTTTKNNVHGESKEKKRDYCSALCLRVLFCNSIGFYVLPLSITFQQEHLGQQSFFALI